MHYLPTNVIPFLNYVVICPRVTSQSGNLMAVSEKPDSSSYSASWSEASPVQQISVTMFARNQLGSAQSDTHNFTLRDIGMGAPSRQPLQNTE